MSDPNFRLELTSQIQLPTYKQRIAVVARMQDIEGNHYCLAIPYKKGYIPTWYTEEDLIKVNAA